MKKLLSITILTTFVLFLWGALVRSTESGLACPDWPLCHGKIIPPFELPIMLEWTHRLLASLVGFLTLGLMAVILKNPEHRKQNGVIVAFTFVVLIAQALLGALTVKGLLHPSLVTIHLAVGMSFLLLLTWMMLRANEASYEIPPICVSVKSKMSVAFWLLTLLIFIQIAWGGVVSSSHAGLACPDFPTCLGAWVPPLKGMVGLHFFHRILAYSIFIFIVGIFIQSRRYPMSRAFNKGVTMLLVIVVIQILFGITNVLLKLPTPIRIAHLGFATMLLAMSYVTAYKLSHARLH